MIEINLTRQSDDNLKIFPEIFNINIREGESKIIFKFFTGSSTL